MALDDRNVYERVRNAARAICGHGTINERLDSASIILRPLLIADFPTEEMGQRFTRLRQLLAVAINEEQQNIAAVGILDLYEGVCQLQHPKARGA